MKRKTIIGDPQQAVEVIFTKAGIAVVARIVDGERIQLHLIYPDDQSIQKTYETKSVQP